MATRLSKRALEKFEFQLSEKCRACCGRKRTKKWCRDLKRYANYWCMACGGSGMEKTTMTEDLPEPVHGLIVRTIWYPLERCTRKAAPYKR